jgi:hypothetical protein
MATTKMRVGRAAELSREASEEYGAPAMGADERFKHLPSDYRYSLQAAVKDLVVTRFEGNESKASRMTGIPQQTLNKIIRTGQVGGDTAMRLLTFLDLTPRALMQKYPAPVENKASAFTVSSTVRKVADAKGYLPITASQLELHMRAGGGHLTEDELVRVGDAYDRINRFEVERREMAQREREVYESVVAPKKK